MENEQVAAQDRRPKQLLDLPNEVIGRICEYLAPAEFEPRPFEAKEIEASAYNKRVWGWSSVEIDHGLEDLYEDGYDNIDISYGDPQIFPVLLKTTGSKAHRHNHLANFAATCKTVNCEVKSLTVRRSFLLTISNDGLTFEGLRSGGPRQTFRTSQGWAMIDPRELQVFNMQNGKVPGNTAFEVFSRIIARMYRLRIHVRADLDHTRTRKLEFFLSHIRALLRKCCRRQYLLPSIDLTLDVGFHHFFASMRQGSYVTLSLRPQRVPYHIAQVALRQEPEKRTVVNAVAPELATSLQRFLWTLFHVQREQNHLGTKPMLLRSPKRQPFTYKVSVQDSGLGQAFWDRNVCAFSDGPGPRLKVYYGTFECFCRLLQKGVYHRTATAENTTIEQHRFRCKLGLSGAKEHTGSEAVGCEAGHKRRAENEGDNQDDTGRCSKQQKVV